MRQERLNEWYPSIFKQNKTASRLPLSEKHLSHSLKAVGPAILGEVHSYDGMAVPDGSAAQRAFEELISDHTSPSRKSELKEVMLEFCRRDTRVMVDLVKWLYAQSQGLDLTH